MSWLCAGLLPGLLPGLLLLAPVSAAVATTTTARSCAAQTPLRSPIVVMGRAEKRAAAKRAKKGGTGGGRATSGPARDRMSRDAVLTKLREVPVFGLQAGVSEDGEPSYLTADDGCSSFFLDDREAELACAKLGKGLQVNGITLDKIFFDPNVRLKPAAEGVQQARGMVKGGEPDVSVPLFAIDGMQVEDKDTGVRCCVSIARL